MSEMSGLEKFEFFARDTPDSPQFPLKYRGSEIFLACDVAGYSNSLVSEQKENEDGSGGTQTSGHLDSPCINTGLSTGAPATDILGNSRIGAVDMGAYEYQGSVNPTPPTTPEGRLALTYTITKPSTAPAGKTVQYTYRWTSDKGDSLTHGPTTALADTVDMDLVQAGETWTVTVTPKYDTTSGIPATAKVKILSPQNTVNQWMLYK